MAAPSAEEKKQEVSKSPLGQVQLQNAKATASVIIHLFGACVTSWTVDGEEQLFVSSKAKLDGSKAIRGGIPLVYPQFGPGKMKQHGFARVYSWTLQKQESNSAVLRLCDDDLSADWKAQFPYKFALQYTVQIRDDNSLHTELTVENLETQKTFDFTVLFHSYFKVNAAQVRVLGLKGVSFEDKVEKDQNVSMKKEENEEVTITQETDRIYLDINNKEIVVLDPSKSKYQQITIARSNFVDVVVWNPWIEKAKNMSDFDDGEYKNMICVEPGSVAKPVNIAANERKKFTQTLSVATKK